MGCLVVFWCATGWVSQAGPRHGPAGDVGRVGHQTQMFVRLSGNRDFRAQTTMLSIIQWYQVTDLEQGLKGTLGLRRLGLTDELPQRSFQPTYVYHRNEGGHHSVVLPLAHVKGQV